MAAILCAAILLSCSVKEDRTDCPCFLTLDLRGVETAALTGKGLDSLALAVRAGEDFYVEEAFALRDLVQEYDAAVPKTRVDILAACGAGKAELSSGGMIIPEGSECPPLYLFSDSFKADAATARRSVALHKSYCAVTASMKRSFNAPARPFRIRLEGKVCGTLMDGTPAEGLFSCFSSPSAGGLCRLNVPRQKDASLRLEVHFLDTEEVRSFPIGEYIQQSGYDWSAPDLEDVSVEMDFSRSVLTVSTSRWKKTLSFEITF